MSDTAASQTAPLAQLVDLTDRTAIVTGGAMGIGLGIARRLHEAGASVVIADLDEAAAAAEADVLQAGRPDSALAVATDVSTPEGAARMVDAARPFGGIDISSTMRASIRW